MLHVQPDAPPEVIKANYRTLMRKLKLHPDLGGDHWNAAYVNAAFEVLSDPALRAAYDRELFARYNIETLSRGPFQARTRQAEAPSDGGRAPLPALPEPSDRIVTANPPGPETSLPTSLATLQGRLGQYAPVIERYCLFCKTPHLASDIEVEETGCVECGSPLLSPQPHFQDQVRRFLGRCPRNETISFSTRWPGVPHAGHLLDLSPAGLRLQTETWCEVGDIIKIEARRLQAVGSIVHVQPEATGRTAGVRFHTVGFAASRGSFVSLMA